MMLSSNFDIPSGFQLGKIPQEFPFQGPVFFGLSDSEPRNPLIFGKYEMEPTVPFKKTRFFASL